MKRLGRIAVLAITAAGLGLVLTVASSREMRAAAAELMITVANTTANPVPTEAVNTPATQPFGWVATGQATLVVPAGKRLVITDVSGISNPLFYANLLISATAGGTETGVVLPFSAGLAGDSYLGRTVHMYADPSTTVSLKFTPITAGPYKTNPPVPTVYINGYFVTLH